MKYCFDMEDKKKYIDELVEFLNKANHDYYVENSPMMSDFDFDMKLKELEKLEMETGYVLPYSPTQRIGSDLQEEFKEVPRKRIMGSIANCYDKNELRQWLSKFNDEYMILEPKYDGSSCSLIYKDGVLIQASTRGSGYSGSDITANVKTIKNIPLKIDFSEFTELIPGKIEIRGEILLPKSELKRINIERESQGLSPFANERNAAAGSLKQLDPSVTASRNLIFKPYSVYCEDEEFTNKFLMSQSDMLSLAYKMGFDNNYSSIFKSNEWNIVENLLNEFEEKYLNTQDFCMDGCVIKVNSFKRQEELGYTQKVPHWAKAFKFKQEQASTKLKGVILQMGMSGQISFVGDVEPVEVDGTIISRVTLNNIDFIRDMGLKIGDYVFIHRGGAVIPVISGVDYERNLIEGVEEKEIEEPSICPFCGEPLSRKIDGGAHLYCTNLECEERVIQKLTHFVKKECMNIDGLSDKTLRRLFEAGIVKSWKDLVKVTTTELYSAGLGPKISENIVDNVRKSIDELGPERSLASLGIPMVGKVTAQKIIDKYGSLSNIWEEFCHDSLDISEMGTVVNDTFIKYLDNNVDEFLDAIKYLPNEKKDVVEEELHSNVLSGLRMLATGTLKNFSREGIKHSIISNGGSYASGVNGKLDILLVGSDAGSSKLKKAKDLGIRMINEQEYINMIGGIELSDETEDIKSANAEQINDHSVCLF